MELDNIMMPLYTLAKDCNMEMMERSTKRKKQREGERERNLEEFVINFIFITLGNAPSMDNIKSRIVKCVCFNFFILNGPAL